MHFSMRFPMGIVGKFSIANHTSKWFFTQMNADMTLEISAVSKNRAAEVTFES